MRPRTVLKYITQSHIMRNILAEHHRTVVKNGRRRPMERVNLIDIVANQSGGGQLTVGDTPADRVNAYTEIIVIGGPTYIQFETHTIVIDRRR